MKNISEIIFEELPGKEGNVGLITLNRPQVLNALNHPMFLALDEQIAEWETKPSIKAILIRGEGRAFCAGGDIRHAYERKRANDPALLQFFADEYRMNSRIHHLKKPYIAFLSGLTMGGGAGISLHGSHRIATEKFIFAMPETAIGFYPDVGTLFYLSRLPSQMGFYLGLTGARIDYADCLMLKIVQEIVEIDAFPQLLESLLETSLPNKEVVSELLQSYSIKAPHSKLLTHQFEIETCFAKNTIEEIIVALENLPSEWATQTAASLKTKSPTSLKVTLKALQIAKKLSFDECMKMEYRLTAHFLQGHDFFEGIRAIVIDKDQKPMWSPAKLSEISCVENYFDPLPQELSKI